MSVLQENMQDAAETGAYAGAGAAALLFGLDANELAVIASATFGGLSFAVHLYFSWRRDRREQRILTHTLEIAHAHTPHTGEGASRDG